MYMRANKNKECNYCNYMFNKIQFIIMKKNLIVLATGLFCWTGVHAATNYYVYDGDKSAADNGTALQAAIDAAAESGIDTLKVQAGTYQGNFTMKQGVNVIGGWNKGFTSQTDYATILDAQANGRVVNQEAEFTTLTVWENLTIQNGKDESGTGGGGAWLNRLGQLKHCLIQNNTTTNYGGGVAHNVTAQATHGEVVISDCWIRNNVSAKQGGGVRIGAKIENSLIERNTSSADGGGVYLQHGCIYNCVIRLNHSTVNAGGIRAFGYTEIWNNLIYANLADGQLGGLSQGGTNRTSNVVNNTIVCNRQISTTNPHRCGAMCGDNATKAVFANNVVWKNYVNDAINATQADLNSNRMGTEGVITNNAYSGNTIGDAPVALAEENPGFVDVTNADTTLWNLHLLFSSALLDKGSDSYVTATDLAGNARKAGNHVDIGAYELPYYTLTIEAFDHATLTVGGETKTAGDYSLPKGYTTTATIEPDENYSITSVTCGDAILTPEAGIYTLPALLTNMTLTITVQSTPTGIVDANTAVKAVKVIRNGQLLIIRDGKEFNVLGSQL